MPELFNPEKMNIQNLMVEQPERYSVIFNPEKEVTDEDWQGMVESLLETRKEAERYPEWQSFLAQAHGMKVLFPERAQEFLPSELWRNIKWHLESLMGGTPAYANYRGEALEAFWLFPEHHDEIKAIGEKRNLLSSLNSELYQDIHQNRFWTLMDNALAIKVLFPEKDDVSNKSEIWQLAKVGLARYLTSGREKGEWQFFGQLLMKTKILLPKFAPEVQLEPNDWQLMKRKLEEIRSAKDYRSLAFNAAAMKAIYAEAIWNDETGLHFALPKEGYLTQSPKSTPEQKRF